MANMMAKDEPDGLEGLFPAALRGLITGMIIVAALTLILSAVAISMDDPSSLLGVFAVAALIIGAAADGFAASRAYQDSGILAGILGGTLYVLLLWLISLFFRGGDSAVRTVTPLGMALGYAGCIAAALVGGLIGRPRRAKVGEGRSSPAALARKQLRNARR